MAVNAIEDLDESRAKSIGLPADLVVTLIRLAAVDPASVEALSRVAAERLRQVEVEGWTAEHDSQHRTGELAMAGASYAVSAQAPDWWRSMHGPGCPSSMWPWGASWWKPSTRDRDLEKGGALVIAEMARRIRAEGGRP